MTTQDSTDKEAEVCRLIRQAAGRLNKAALQLEDDGRRYSTAAHLREISQFCAELADKLMKSKL